MSLECECRLTTANELSYRDLADVVAFFRHFWDATTCTKPNMMIELDVQIILCRIVDYLPDVDDGIVLPSGR